MAIKKILKIAQYEKFLRTPSEPVKKINREIKQIIEDLKDTMADPSIPALGLAAPQIGSHKRIFGVYIGYFDRAENDPQPPIATIFINPVIVDHPAEPEVDAEACLSIPNMSGNVPRPLKIVLRYMDERGATVERVFTGSDARAIQHELDHLDGILFLDRLTSPNELFVHVRDENGETTLVPYPEVMSHMARPAKPGTVPLPLSR
jgi:peptide deformylase